MPSQPFPSLTLYYHPLSPFTRKVWLTALEHHLTPIITLVKVVVAPVVKPKGWPGWSENNDLVGSFNPIAKIPTLVVKYPDQEEFAVYDSKIICEFLESLAGKGGGVVVRDSMYWKRQALHRAADQMMDCKIAIAYEERIRKPEGVYFQPWVEGMQMKITRGLDLLERAVGDGTLRQAGGGDIGLEEVAVVCCLANMAQTGMQPGMNWRDGREKLSAWLEAWKGRASFEGSKPDVEWVGKKEGGQAAL